MVIVKIGKSTKNKIKITYTPRNQGIITITILEVFFHSLDLCACLL